MESEVKRISSVLQCIAVYFIILIAHFGRENLLHEISTQISRHSEMRYNFERI